MIVGVRNLRVAVFVIVDAVAVIIRIRDIRIAITIGIQLEVRSRLIHGAIRVGHRNWNIELFRGVLAQLGLIREGHGDLTGGLVDGANGVALRRLEVLWNFELGALRSVDLILSRVTVFVLPGLGKRRLGLRLLTRNNKLVLVRWLEDRVLVRRNGENRVSASDDATLGLRVTGFVLHRGTVLVENRHLQFIVTHDDWERKRLTRLLSSRLKRHNTSRRINLDLIRLDTLRQRTELKESLLRLLLLDVCGSRVVELRIRGSLCLLRRVNLVVRQVVTTYSEGIHSQNKIASSRLTLSDLQTSSERITRLCIRRNIELTARDLGSFIHLGGWALLYRVAVLVIPLNVVVQVLGKRQTRSIRLYLVTNRCPVISGVLIHHIKLQRLRRKRDVPTGVAVGSVTDQGTVTTEELRVSTSIQISTEAWASPLTKRPRVQHTNIIRQWVAGLVINADVAPVHVHVLGVQVTVSPRPLVMRTSQGAKLALWNNSAAVVGVAVDTLPAQLELTISTSGGSQGLCDPLFRVLGNLLINPLLQPLLISRSPVFATQRLARKVILRILLNLAYCVIGEVGANHLQPSGRNIPTINFTHGVVVQTPQQHMQVPKRLTSVSATVTTRTSTFLPLVLRKVLRQLILLRVLDGHTRDLVITPRTVPLSRRRCNITNGREDTSSRLVHQTILIRHVLRKLRPHADLLALVITLTPIRASGQTNRCIRIKETGRTNGIGVRRHLDREVTVRIRLGVVHRRRVLSIHTLVPLRVDLDTRNGVTGILNIAETNTGLNNLLNRTRDRALLVRLAWRINGLLVTANGWCISRRRRIGILIRLRSRRSFLRKRNRLRERRNQRKRQRSRSHRRAATTSDVILLHRKFLPRK